MSNTLITTFTFKQVSVSVAALLFGVFWSGPAVIYMLFLGVQRVTLLQMTENKTTNCAASGSSLILK